MVALGRNDHLPQDAIVAALETRLSSPDRTLLPLVDTNVVRTDANFVAYMTAANDRLAESQTSACRRISSFAAGMPSGKRKRCVQTKAVAVGF